MSEASAQVQQFDIAIVGGGIVGLSLALAFCRTSFSVALIDNQQATVDLDSYKKSYDPRVSALTLASRDLLVSLGVWEKIEQVRAAAYSEMFVWDADGTGSIHFSAAEVHQQALGYITENRLITMALNEALAEHENVTIIRPDSMLSVHKADNGSKHQLILESGKKLEGSLVIGADGGNSQVREQKGFTIREWAYEHRAIVTTVKTEKQHQHTAWQSFMQTGPLAFLPLSSLGNEAGEHYSSIVWSCVPELAEELMQMDDKDFLDALGAAFEYKLGKIEHAEPRFCFPLWQRHANDYVKAGVALIGDAAHTIHPLAGQGVNLGLLDVAALVKVLETALENGEDFACEQTLSRYQRQRKGSNLGMMMVMEGFKRLFASNDLSLRWIRNLGIKGVDNTPFIKNQIMVKAMGL